MPLPDTQPPSSLLNSLTCCFTAGSSEPQVPTQRSAWESSREQLPGDVCCVCSGGEGSETRQGAEGNGLWVDVDEEEMPSPKPVSRDSAGKTGSL